MFIEHRNLPVEMRAAADRTVSGYAAVFNTETDMAGYYLEQIAPGAFRDSLRSSDHDIFGCWNHNHDIALASRDEGTLKLSEDTRGLVFDMRLDSDPWSDLAYRSIKSGRIKHMSFGFRVNTDHWSMRGARELRTLLSIDLLEVSPVLFPQYPETSVEARTAKEVWERHKGTARTPSGQTASPKFDLLVALNKNRLRRLQLGGAR